MTCPETDLCEKFLKTSELFSLGVIFPPDDADGKISFRLHTSLRLVPMKLSGRSEHYLDWRSGTNVS
jgi:hypothetical protein